MTVKFSTPMENAVNFPSPHILANPKFSLDFISIWSRFAIESEHCIFTKNGRGAIAIAGKKLKKSGKNLILIPAYHCPALVEPFIWLDYEIMFYPIKEDLSVDVAALQQLVKLNDVTHAVVIRYFGFNQNIAEVVPFLKQNNIAVLEDCAHSLFSFRDNINDSEFISDAQICSINKILPSIDGGILYMRDQSLPHLIGKGIKAEIKGLLYTLGISQVILKLRRSGQQKTPNESMSVNKKFRYFEPNDVMKASYSHTKVLAKYSDMKKIAKLRRRNFEYISSNIRNDAPGQLLFKTLADNEVPYVVPFLLHSAASFKQLRMKGIQALRWEELADSDCDICSEFRDRLIQLPCHHKMTTEQLDQLIETINNLS